MKSASTPFLLACALADCTLPLAVRTMPSSYTPGSLAQALSSSTHALDTFGCVDVAVSLAGDAARPALEWRMGNRCDASVSTDTSSLVVTAFAPDEAETLVALAHRAEDVGPRDLAPRCAAVDRIALSLPARAARVCVSYFSVVTNAATRERAPACFEWREGWVVARG